MRNFLSLSIAIGFAFSAQGAAAQGLVGYFDKDSDGKVSLEEFEQALTANWDKFANGEERILFADLTVDRERYALGSGRRDSEGYLTRAEYLGNAHIRFAAADANSDGYLNGEELGVAMTPVGL